MNEKDSGHGALSASADVPLNNKQTNIRPVTAQLRLPMENWVLLGREGRRWRAAAVYGLEGERRPST